MDSEKVKEIKKALEDNANYKYHDKFSYIDGYKCKPVAFADILTLINELESENEILRNAKVVYETVDYCAGDLRNAENRIAELEKENETKTNTIIDLLKKQEFYETEKLKQFAERLQEKLSDKIGYDRPYVMRNIDETLKEFVNETNE